MSYGQFKSTAEVAERFDITVANRSNFIQQTPFSILDIYLQDCTEKFSDDVNFMNEFTICETIIRPMLNIVIKNHPNLKIWSHVPYNIDEKSGLVGEPDYLIAPKTKYGAMAIPALCIIEAKKDDFAQGWTQALAEMVASSLSKVSLCYGVVTTGKLWEFGKLQHGVFNIDPQALSATSELPKVLYTLNWLFSQAELLTTQ